MELEEELKRTDRIKKNLIETFQCRFMGTINTFEYVINGKQKTKAILKKGLGGANILPVDAQGNVILETQYRFPLRKIMLETPAGRAEEGETLERAAKRELSEETGNMSDNIECQAIFYPDPNFTDEKIGSYVAKDCMVIGEQKLDKDENVKLYKVSFQVAKELIKRNIICEERAIISIAHEIIFNRKIEENSNKESNIEKIISDMKKDEEELREVEKDIIYSYDCEFGNVTDYKIITSNGIKAKRECMSLEPVNIVIPVSKNNKIGVNIKYLVSTDKNSIELSYISDSEKNDSIESLGNFYTCVGYANSLSNIFIEKNLDETDKYMWLSIEELKSLISNKKIENGIVLATLLKYMLLS